MEIEIRDDFDLSKIAFCGQCFRASVFDDGTFRFITGSNVLYIRALGGDTYSVSCTAEEWARIWHPYFDLTRDYAALRERACRKRQAFIRKATECGCGIRVLRQDPWEMLITFILSQRKSIPAIAKSVETLAERYGRVINTERECVYTFPTALELRDATEDALRECALGYRAAYVAGAVRAVLSGEVDLDALASCGDEELFLALQGIPGVGKKVSNCVCLFGYGRTSRAPVDVWIARAIEEECRGKDPFPRYRADAGIIQQYVFYYEKSKNRKSHSMS